MSEKTYQRQKGGPGPPQLFSREMTTPYPMEQRAAGKQGQAGPAPSGPGSGSIEQVGQSMGSLGLMRAGQQGLRMNQHPGMAFMPTGFPALCGGGGAPNPSMAAAPGYYSSMAAAAPGYPSVPSVASMYPYGVLEQNAGGSVALDLERLAAINRALALAHPPATAAAAAVGLPVGAIESAWGSHGLVRNEGWRHTAPAPTRASPSPQLSFSIRPTGSSAVTTSASSPTTLAAKTSKLPPSAAATKAMPSPSSASRPSESGGKGVARHETRTSPPSSSAAVKAAAAAAEAATTGEVNKGHADRETKNKLSSSPTPSAETSTAETSETLAAAAAATESVPEFEIDSAGKRRRLTAEERLQRSRERNQLHARKTRQRKKAQLQLLMARSAELQAEQQRLRQAITDRRTASILLDMSGSEDPQAGGKANKPCRGVDHPPALAAMSGKTPRAGMLCALESDDSGEGCGKGAGGNGSDDFGSESAAGTSCSASSSGRTSSEANSSDGATGGGERADDEQPRVGNPGDAERLLELSQKTRSECTPEELEQIRRERNRMHAKRTRDRKKLYLEATESIIARLEQENSKLRDSMKTIGSSGGGGGGSGGGGVDHAISSVDSAPSEAKVTAAVAVAASSAPSPDARADGKTALLGKQPPAVATQQQQQHSGAQVHHHHVHPPSHPLVQQYVHHAFLNHGPHVQPRLHGHLYPAQHHLQHGSHLMRPLPTQQQQQQQHLGYFPHHGFEQIRGCSGGGGGGAGSVKVDANSFLPGGGRIPTPVGMMDHSNPNYLLRYPGFPSAFGPSLGDSSLFSSPQQPRQVYPVPEPPAMPGSKSPDSFLGRGASATTAFMPWASVSFASSAAGGGADAPEMRLRQKEQQHPSTSSSSSSSAREAENGGENKMNVVSDAKNWGASKIASSGVCTSGGSGSSSGNSGGGGGGSHAFMSVADSRCLLPSAADINAARNLTRARADRAERAAAEQAREEDQHRLDQGLSRGCREAWQKVRRERNAKRKRSSRVNGGSDSDSDSDSGNGSDRICRRRLSGTSRGVSPDSGSERESGGGSGGEGSECSSTSSSWMEGSESSSVLPGSTTSFEMGRGGRSSGSDSSVRSSGSPYSSSSGGEGAGSMGWSGDTKRDAKLERSCGSAERP